MKIASWILTALSYVCGIALSAVGVATEDDTFFSYGFSCFFVIGFVGHLLISIMRKRGDKIGKDGLAVYILSFPPFLAIGLVALVFILILKLSDLILYLLKGEHPLSSFCSNAFGVLLGKPSESASSESKDVYTVYDFRAKNGTYYGQVDFELVQGGYVRFPVDGKPIDGVTYPTDNRQYPLYRDVNGLAPECTSLDNGKTLTEIPKDARYVQVYHP